jgi:MerR family transcriptional regulator/heat shock protein HspR
MKRKAKGYTISAVADHYGVHQQTLRMYEREGLLKPSRSDGNVRLYTDQDLEQLELILNLTRDLGVNLAGVEIILNMREKMDAARLHGQPNRHRTRHPNQPGAGSDSPQRSRQTRQPPLHQDRRTGRQFLVSHFSSSSPGSE